MLSGESEPQFRKSGSEMTRTDLRNLEKVAHVSVDLDPVDTHLAGYGLACAPCDRIYRTSVPRILDLLDRVGIKATLFVIARDAEREAALLRDAADRGHEIASHSVTHPIPFATLPPDMVARELRESRQRLEDVLGQPVVGFRARLGCQRGDARGHCGGRLPL